MRFVYYLAAIGNSNLERKLAILSKNLNYIYNNINVKFDIIVNCYNNYDAINFYLQGCDFLNKILIHNKKGVLTELFLTNPYNASLVNYDYILFILDDVEIQGMDIRSMISIKERFKIEILSPKVINSTHSFMNIYDSNTLTINNAVEVYCLLLKYKDFVRFTTIHTVENKWMWGADFLFGYFNIKAGVYNGAVVKHMLLPSKRNINNANNLMHDYLRKVNFRGTLNEIIPVKNVINLKTGANYKQPEYNQPDYRHGDSGADKFKLLKGNFKNISDSVVSLNKNRPHANVRPHANANANTKARPPIHTNVKVMGSKIVNGVKRPASELNKLNKINKVKKAKKVNNINKGKISTNKFTISNLMSA